MPVDSLTTDTEDRVEYLPHPTKISPFIFLIREKATGSILFPGRLIDPTQ